LLAVHIGDAGYNGIQILDYRIRLTFEVGYMALRQLSVLH